MTTITYPGYDGGFTRSLSRRPSLSYIPAPRSHAYSDHQGMYDAVVPAAVPTEYHRPIYPSYAHSAPIMQRAPSSPYEDHHDGYYRDGARTPVAPPMIYPSTSMGARQRRHSNVGYAPPPVVTTYRAGSGASIKFKRKGAFTAGISLAEAQSHVRLSGNDSYTVYDLHPDSRNRILLRARWANYAPLTYEIPMDTDVDGRVSLSTLARRVSRACVHYLETNHIPVVWDRVELHHLEEVQYGVWQPMLSAH